MLHKEDAAGVSPVKAVLRAQLVGEINKLRSEMTVGNYFESMEMIDKKRAQLDALEQDE